MSNELLAKIAELEAKLAAKKPAKSTRKSEADLLVKYPHMVEGSLGFDEAARKQYAIIRCHCGAERTTWTSDLFQIKECDACRTASKKAAKKAKCGAEKAAIEELKALKAQLQS